MSILFIIFFLKQETSNIKITLFLGCYLNLYKTKFIATLKLCVKKFQEKLFYFNSPFNFYIRIKKKTTGNSVDNIDSTKQCHANVYLKGKKKQKRNVV